jgi:hypothetical protein
MEAAIINPAENSNILILPPIAIHISFETLLSTIETLSNKQKWQLYQALGAEIASQSAEAKAIARLQDENDPSKWISAIDEDEEIDEQDLNIWLARKGY